jgi:hypothetical protein
MSHDVFISYCSKDKAIADAVCAKLENNKIRCWIAPRDILPGKEYGQALVDAIKKSRAVVLVLSSNSNVSPQVMREIERAVSNEIPIIPLRIENILPSDSMEYYLSSVHWLDAITPPIEQHLDKLTDTVVRILGGKVSLGEEAGELPRAWAASQRMGVETTRDVFPLPAAGSQLEKNPPSVDGFVAALEGLEGEAAKRKEAAARQEAEENARREEQARQRIAMEDKARQEAEKRLRQEAEMAAQEQAWREAQEREQRAAEQRAAEIARLQREIETALVGGEWGKARQLIPQLKNLGSDGQVLADRLQKRLPKNKIPGWAWVMGSLVFLGIILGVVFLGGGNHATQKLPVDTPHPVVQATEKPVLQPVPSDTPTLISATPTLSPTPTGTPLSPVVLRINANVRAGPGTVYPVLAIYTSGTQVRILGRNHAGDWLAIALPGNKQGWVAVSSLQVGFDVKTLAELEAPPAPALEPSPTEASHPAASAEPPTLAPP